MTFFPDMSAYSNMIELHIMINVVNVGWIDIQAEFKKGRVSPIFIAKLMEIACGSESVRALVEPARELPRCPICGIISLPCGKNLLPDSELWIPGRGVIYASPISIIHYIGDHGYLPPQDYLDAVCNFGLKQTFNADEIYRHDLVESGWFASTFGKS